MISVIMSIYREPENILKIAIESILNQTFQDFEFLIVADDPENEELIDCVKTYANQDERIRFFVNEKNMGLANSLNRLIREAKGEYIARMDADDFSEPTRLEKQLSFMKENNLDIISCDVRVIDEQGNTIQMMKNLPNTDKKIRKKLQYNNCLPHPGWMVRKEVYISLGGYDNTPYCEDYEFLLKVRGKDYKFGNINEVLLQYRMTNVSISRSNLFKQYLAMKYCQERYIKHKEITFSEYQESYYDPEEERKYNECANVFSESLSNLSAHHFGKAFIGLNKAFWGSRFYRDKMFKYVLQLL